MRSRGEPEAKPGCGLLIAVSRSRSAFTGDGDRRRGRAGEEQGQRCHSSTARTCFVGCAASGTSWITGCSVSPRAFAV